MKKIVISCMLTICSLSAFAQNRNNELFDKIYQSGVVCNLEEFMVEHSLNLLKQDPTNEMHKEQLASAQSSSAHCMSAAVEAIHSACEPSIDRLLDKGLICTSEEATVEAAYIIYKAQPTAANKAELEAAQKLSARCGAKAYAICAK